MDKLDFIEALTDKTPLTDEFVELVSGMYLYTYQDKYVIDKDNWLYRVNYDERRLTMTGEKVDKVWQIINVTIRKNVGGKLQVSRAM